MTGLVHHYGLLALFLLVMLESSGVPLPGETALVTAGIFASRGDLVIEEVIVVAAAAAIIGDNIGYWIGREGGNRLLDSVGPLRRWSAPGREWSERFFEKTRAEDDLHRALRRRPARHRRLAGRHLAHALVDVLRLERGRRHLLGAARRPDRLLLRTRSRRRDQALRADRRPGSCARGGRPARRPLLAETRYGNEAWGQEELSREARSPPSLLARVRLLGGAQAVPPPVPSFQHVLVIVMENKAQSDVLGNRHAPHFNALASRYAVLSGYGGVSHPSLPNYLALVSGSTHGIHDDCTTCLVSGRNLADTARSLGSHLEDLRRRPAEPGLHRRAVGRYAKRTTPSSTSATSWPNARAGGEWCR